MKKKLIDKDTLITEIDRRIAKLLPMVGFATTIKGMNMELAAKELKNLRSFIDTLEVKDVKEDPVSKFDSCIQEGDKLVTNEDGTHFNISQLERVAKVEPKPAWSEDYDGKISELKIFIAKCNGFNRKNREIVFSMIDSLKPQNRWSPSEKQMQALKAIVDEQFDIDGGELYNLYNDLKKLKGE